MSIKNVAITNSATDILTVPITKTYASILMLFCNYSSSTDIDLVVYARQAGAAAGSGTTIAKVRVLAGTTFELNAEKFILDYTDVISAISSTTACVTCTISYIEI